MNEKSKKYASVLMLFIGSLLLGFSMGNWLAPLGLLLLILLALIARS